MNYQKKNRISILSGLATSVIVELDMQDPKSTFWELKLYMTI